MEEERKIVCPHCHKEFDRSEMLFTYDCYGVPMQLVCYDCYDELMADGFDGEPYGLEELGDDDCMEGWE